MSEAVLAAAPSFDAEARRASLRYAAGRIGVYGFLTVFAAIYLRARDHRVLQLVPRRAGDRAERLHLPARKPFPEGMDRGLVVLLRRRHLRGRASQFLQFADDDDPGDDHFDAARRDQRLHPLEVAVSRLGDHFHDHVAGRVHARPDRAAALGVPAGPSRSFQFGLRPDPRSRDPGPVASPRCFAATSTSAFPTTSSRRRASTAPASGASFSRSSRRCRRPS